MFGWIPPEVLNVVQEGEADSSGRLMEKVNKMFEEKTYQKETDLHDQYEDVLSEVWKQEEWAKREDRIDQQIKIGEKHGSKTK